LNPRGTLSPQAQATIPTHVAVIMDGNGRWAKQRRLPRVEGHRNGVESVRAVVRAAGEAGVKYLTLYAFSVENWNRPKDEVDTLMKYLARFLKGEIGELNRNNVRLDAIGQIYRLPEFVQEQLAKDQSRPGQKQRIDADSGAQLRRPHRDRRGRAQHGAEGQGRALEPAEINEQLVSQHLYTCHYPDPDLLIRTSGEMRISNFLLWQISYAELVVTPTLWPDFRKPQFFEALEEYTRRHRRFGLV
jgi:undecaprenyl diphosphate synthase